MSQPLDDSPEGSSSTAAEKTISSLRARLRSEDPFPPLRASKSSFEPYPDHNDIYKQLRAIFPTTSCPRQKPLHTPDRGNIIMDSVADAFARHGEETYKSAVSDLKGIHEAIAGRINAFHTESTRTMSNATALYGNITYPLSMTVCHSNNFPKATIEKHLSILKGRITTAETELMALNAQWAACVEEETKMMTVTERCNDADPCKEMAALTEEIDAIVSNKTAELEQMDKKYCELLQKESLKAVRAMMAD
ncbi:hypothetical protein NOR_08626 [Metarhizium rileyi]|uniref:Nnf1 n=1 Tax=Metarhizium rileyi (strain RCEF 4871) TaxID=1649241 RepID=A0A166VYW1_METRR|nr:hypothetical protein NOR_08626 [Metarhizium rileyi RCEF 4871]TWU71358.1 hypothetical protein ED733_000284 [Metarhizium rileyi]